MPIYEYKCGGCGASFDALQPMNATEEGARCPYCGSEETKRVPSTFSSSCGCGSDDSRGFG